MTTFLVLIEIVAFPIAAASFGFFYAKEEGKSRAFGIFIALLGLALTFLLVWLNATLLIQGIVAFASLYVADQKNRSRTIWTISALLLGAPLLLVLLLLPAKSRETTSLSLT